MFAVAKLLSRGRIPGPMGRILRLGTMTALRKEGGGVRGGRRGRSDSNTWTVAQKSGLAVNAAAAFFQYSLSTWAGCECIAHALQALTELDR